MNKQELARKRNYFKFILSGIQKPLNYDVLSQVEIEKWENILKLRKELIDEFDNTSRELGLKVPEHKCWCGKEANTTILNPVTAEELWICNKHKE